MGYSSLKIDMRNTQFSVLFAILIPVLVMGQAEQVDSIRLEAVESLSESLANHLLEMSIAIRSHDFKRVARSFGASLEAVPFPSRADGLKHEIKWIRSHGWSAEEKDPVARSIPRSEFLAQWEEFLGHFKEIEDFRLKLKKASFENPRIPLTNAQVALFAIGRDMEGRREWVQGRANMTARRSADGWKIEAFHIIELESLVGTEELFSEITIPAGVAANLPAYGTPGNSSFVWQGAAVGDLDNDGLLDLFVTAAARNYLYLNTGRGRFREVSEETGVQILLIRGSQPLILDYDNDGDKDVFISAVGPQMLLENRLIPGGKLEFEDVSLEANVDREAIGFSAAAGDVNGDGYPDIYVTSYNRYGLVKPDSWFQATNGTPNLLFINQRDGTFREAASKWGVADRRWSYAAAFADINEDGRQDLCVANDFGDKAMFVNTGGRFIDEAGERGVVDTGNGMGVAFGDYNNDGRLDLHTSNMSSTAGNRILARLFPDSSAGGNVLKKLASGNSLFENLGKGRFRDVTVEAGGLGSGWAWGGGFIDFDNDGWEDIFVPNGFISGRSMKDT